jgi:hypothetical protein
VNTPFTGLLVVKVSSAYGEPVEGGVVTFTAPSSGASCTFAGGSATVKIGSSGLASIAVAANANAGGPYTVNATTVRAAQPGANFSLTNKP